ncbi:MAG: PAS domain-containing protein [Planctomycetes bacterium]|nr:PAS domain-containing protein [Planctomycetota bacterium]
MLVHSHSCLFWLRVGYVCHVLRPTSKSRCFPRKPDRTGHSFGVDRNRQKASRGRATPIGASQPNLLEGSPVCNKIIDLDSKLQYMSTAGVTQLKIPNIEDFYGCTFPPVLYPESWRILAAEHLEQAKKGETSRLECPVHDTEGQEVWFDTTFVPARDDQGDVEYVIVSSVNITERKKAEEEIRLHQDRLAHLGRLSTMGEMATGLAHEVNQPLAAIANYCYAGLHLLDSPQAADVEALRSLFEKLSEQSLRAGEIIRRLRGLVGQRTFDRSQADIAEPIREVLRLLESNLRQSQVCWEQKTNGNISPVTIDAIQIQQVLVNLIRNAIDAMSETACDQRALTITTSQNQDDFIEVAVRDTGKGLPAEQAEQVFDAFFSNKSEGMGMGLAISRSIIESHGGRMWMMPNSEQGVTFHFSLPIEKEAVL